MKPHLFISNIDILRQLHILEHAFQFASESTAALLFQFAEHGLLCVHRRRLPHQQPLGQVLLVERFEHVLAMYEPEQHHDFV